MKWESYVFQVIDDIDDGKFIVWWKHTDGSNKIITHEKVEYSSATKHETWLNFMKKHNLKDIKNES